jgi:hypothetical protein
MQVYFHSKASQTIQYKIIQNMKIRNVHVTKLLQFPGLIHDNPDRNNKR